MDDTPDKPSDGAAVHGYLDWAFKVLTSFSGLVYLTLLPPAQLSRPEAALSVVGQDAVMLASPLEGSSPGSSGAVRTVSVGSLVLVDAAEGSAEHSVEPMPPSVSQAGEASQEVQVRHRSVFHSPRGLYEP